MLKLGKVVVPSDLPSYIRDLQRDVPNPSLPPPPRQFSINQKPGSLLDSSPSPTHGNRSVSHQILTGQPQDSLHLATFLLPTAAVLTLNSVFIICCPVLCYRFMSVPGQSSLMILKCGMIILAL